MRWRATLAVAIALGLGGCGGSSLSASQLRTGAGRICGLAQRRTARIPTPTAPSGESAYLRRGIAALGPELAGLRELNPPGGMAARYREAMDATAAEVRALRSTVKDLKAGNDPVIAIKTLQQKLAQPEGRAQRAWQALAISSCLRS
jgi:hypothetical protein